MYDRAQVLTAAETFGLEVLQHSIVNVTYSAHPEGEFQPPSSKYDCGFLVGRKR